MNGSTNGVGMPATPSAPVDASSGSQTQFLSQIHEALEIVHDPHSSNEARQKASAYLEEIKSEDEAPYHGFTLAYNRTQKHIVRHYALSLLEYAIKHKWNSYSEEQADALRGWVLQLSENISPDDPLYLRNKTAQLWVEIAKRSWGEQWLNMDEMLVKLWGLGDSLVHKQLVLSVLETLSEDIFNGEDTIAALREPILKRACVEIFTPADVLAEINPDRPVTNERYGEEGWLVRIGELLRTCLASDVQNNEQYRACTIQCLSVFRSVMPWAVPSAIAKANCVKDLQTSLAAPSISIQIAAVEALSALYLKTHFTTEDFLTLVCPLYTSESVDLLRRVFEWSIVDAQDIDEEKYTLGKKLSEMLSVLGEFIEQKISSIPEDCDLPKLLSLFVTITQNQSFCISIPILVTWTRLLRSETIATSPTVTPLIAPLLELCSSRLVRYESLPEDSDDPCMIFLLEDIDTIPERHAFLGNYRRYSVQIIESIVRRKQSDALYHILGQVAHSMEHLYDGNVPFSYENYSKTSMPLLRVDAQFAVVEAALKGYMKWRSAYGNKPENEQERTRLESDFEIWCDRLLAMQFEDPIIRKRILQLAVAFSTSALDKNSGFMLKVLEQLLTSRSQEKKGCQAYSDATKELQNESLNELSRLATKMPDQLLEVYEQLEARVNEIIASGGLDSKQQVSYQTFLFIIIHRATRIDPTIRMQKLEAFITPIKGLWQSSELDASVSSFESFCNLLGLGKARDYMVSHRVHEVQDWSTLQLDEDGQAIQNDLTERVKALPLRPTKSFLACSTEKVEKDTEAWKMACSLWTEAVPMILPDLLKFMSHGHAFYNPVNWAGLPTEMRPIVGRILTDRFWQAGISEGSKDEFYARVSGTRSTMEGLASTIRGSVRTVRDSCYAILYTMSRLDVHFFGFNELPGPLAHALFADAHCLSSHQLINLMNLVRCMVDDCPVELRDHFVPPILATCFSQIDGKISSEWETLGKKQLASTDGEDLTEEMKEESILRQLTHNSVMMVAGFFDPARANPTTTATTNKEASTYHPPNNGNGTVPGTWPSMRQFCLSSLPILEPMILFCTHAIRFRDTRCCGVILRVLRSIVPEFSRSSASTVPIREFISSEVMKACITSLNEPYFVDLQKELAQLIATMLIYYCPLTDTPRQLLASLPGIHETAVDKCIDYVGRPGMQQRQQRALVLDLLADLKGVSISEQGRITKSATTVRKERSKMQQEFMNVGEAERVKRQSSPDLEGVSGMFDG